MIFLFKNKFRIMYPIPIDFKPVYNNLTLILLIGFDFLFFEFTLFFKDKNRLSYKYQIAYLALICSSSLPVLIDFDFIELFPKLYFIENLRFCENS